MLQLVLDRVRWGRAGTRVINQINQTWSAVFSGRSTILRIKTSAVLDINMQRLATLQAQLHIFDTEDVIIDKGQRPSGGVHAALRTFLDASLSLIV